jgi:hypothetical protein
MLSSYLRLGLSDFSAKIWNTFLASPMCATCPVHLITQIILAEKYEVWNCLLRNFL